MMNDRQSELDQAIEDEQTLAKERLLLIESMSDQGILVATTENAKRLADLQRREKDNQERIRKLLDQ